MAFETKAAALETASAFARETRFTPKAAQGLGVAVNNDGQRRSMRDLLAYPDVDLTTFETAFPTIRDWAPAVREQVEIEAGYAGYLDRQAADIAALSKEEALTLPADIDYAAIAGLSHELREKLSLIRPQTLGQANRIEGMTPGALTALLGHVKRRDAA